jgi:Xaa-Pro aminopeptidase
MQIRDSDQRPESAYPSHDAVKAIDMAGLRAGRTEKFRGVLADNDLDALLLTEQENVRYVSDIRPVHSIYFTKSYQAVLTEDELVMFAPAGDVPRIEHQMPWVDRTVNVARADMTDTYRGVLDDVGAETVGVDALDFTLASELDGVVPVGDDLARTRGVKLPEEVAIMDDAGALCEKAVLAALDRVEQGVREYEVAAEAEYVAKKEGAQGVSWNPATFSGTNAGIFLRYDSAKRLRYGDFVVLGYAFVYEGYNMDITVTTVVGEPTQEQQEMYTAVWDAREAAIETAGPGVTAREVRDAAAAVIDDAGFGDISFTDYQPIFHGLGMNVYEPPFAPDAEGDEPNHTLEPGHVIVPEPGVYATDEPSRGGIRIGEPVLVTEDGTERLAQVVPDRHDDLYLG